ncbi:peptidyl-prolyl cis-trans isomerase, cyclophilin-type family protein [Trichomonas vaginalis G3]|uniref:Peptidyl-prolyl cis-trans isomerase n=1 Tax=Trichomonas vaginalis (strain ATCC PRA-98 / G3) TaxID=412133 RepID=A2FIV3_TRIV3|nr:peptidyl-prolyl cis-trans isomerase protein [Trichomonas vaginalis G3]EAX95168.1 peptidyl-prolyl cis-trans isomerase, cyclophilin-type family protein [Trichomonas vaginalis G3]KAI5514510.1 peptidyl-prolyl cis-trans isomerase protein [Trichomonas vaginalis G3]|eukprot:XP_001308098.1 peptidyl-prolyl cis-trans isomerase, cyclophilin-type family protein [Trichomonas vaginalis G3]
MFLGLLLKISTSAPIITNSTYLVFEKEGKRVGKVIFGLYYNECPKTVENYLAAFSCQPKREFCYNNTYVAKLNPNKRLSIGVTLATKSVKGDHESNHEENKLLHDRAYLITSNTHYKTFLTGEFYITFRAWPKYNEENIVFGRVLRGFDVLEKLKINSNEKDVDKIKIIDSGIIQDDDDDDYDL